MIHALILADNTYSSIHIGVNRAPGAHRIASHLRRNGYQVEVVDYCLRWTLEEFQALCSKLVTDKMLFLGIGASLFFDKPVLNELLSWFKHTYPHIPIVLGGSNVIYRDIQPVDYLVDGYAENAIMDLIQVFEGKKSLADLQFRYKGDVKYIDCNGCYGNVDVSDLSIDYLTTDFLHADQTLGIETARGCIFKCKFCTYPLLGKKKVDYLRDPVSLKNELQRNYDLWGTTKYIINEDTLNDSIDKLRALEKVITSLPFKIEFVAYNRLDLMLAHPESVDILDRIGVRAIHFGIETFNSKAARVIGKNPNIDRMKEGLLWLRKRLPHVNIQCGMILGLPEDDNDPWEDVAWYQRSGIDFYNFNPLYLTDVNRVVNTSEFSRNYRSYGFELMTPSEIQEEVEQGLGDPKDFMHNRNGIWLLHKNQAHLEKMLYWKNVKNGNNYFKSSRLSVEIAARATDRHIMSWTLFEYSSLGYSIDECRTWNSHKSGKNPFPEKILEQKANSLIDNYKRSKLEFDYNKFYSS